jgi:ABC-type branched-subunit amino acid transport system ATPase component
VLGHNGMGKTTLLRSIMGFVNVTGGTVNLQGQPIQRLATHKRSRLGLSLVPQGREIFPNLTVMENLTVGAIGKGGSQERIDEVLEYFPRLHDLLDRRGGALSGGEQQLLALARCLCNRPSLILLDEPTEGIQPSIIQEISEVLNRLRKSQSLTIVLVEQNLDFIASLAERVLIIQKGQITRQVEAQHLGDASTMGEFTGFTASTH